MNELLFLIPIIGLFIHRTKFHNIFIFGVFFHELGHYMFLKLLRVRIYNVNLLKSVTSEKVDTMWKEFLICFGPFILNFTLAGLTLYYTIDTSWNILGAFVATGLVLHAAASKTDIKILAKTFIGLFIGNGSVLDYLTLLLFVLAFFLAGAGYIAFDSYYMLGVVATLLIFLIITVSAVIGEIATILLLILVMYYMSGQIEVSTLIEYLKQISNQLSYIIKI